MSARLSTLIARGKGKRVEEGERERGWVGEGGVREGGGGGAREGRRDMGWVGEGGLREGGREWLVARQGEEYHKLLQSTYVHT